MTKACKKSYLKQHDVFIAYASSDYSLAASLCQVVEGQGFSVFIDKRTPAGKRFREYLVEQLEHAKVVIILWTDEFTQHDFTMDEVDLALKQGSYFGVMLEELEPKKFYGTNQRHRFDLKGWRGDADDSRLDALLSNIRHFYDERRNATLLQATPPKSSVHDQVSQSKVDEDREELLTCMVDRSEQIETIDGVFKKTQSSHYGVFLIEAYEKHGLDALAEHLALRQDGDYALLEDTSTSLTSAIQATLIKTGDIGREHNAFIQLLASTFRLTDRSPEQAAATELCERVMQGRQQVTVIYVPLIDSRDRRHMDGIIGGTLDFLGKLAPFKNGRRLIVLFGCNYMAERSFSPLVWLYAWRLKRLCKRGLIQLDSPGMILLPHIERWFNNFPACDKTRYRFRAIEQAVKQYFDQPESYYKTLRTPLAEALKAARHK